MSNNVLNTFFKVSVNSLFLKKQNPLPGTIQLLKDVYPGVNWSRVRFYEGLPWFTPLVAPYVTAQALPDFYSFGKLKIYIKKFDESNPECLADIVHEGYHITQYMHFLKGYGFGFLRGLMVYYNAYFFKYGYRQNPFEVPAYDQEARIRAYFKSVGDANPGIPINLLLKKVVNEPALRCEKIKFKYDESFLVLAGSFILCLFIAVFKPFADLLVFIAGALKPA
ncbi:MAG: hypothetical protein JWO32_1942 [Bacteroidetes bacterium]|nr:hypothetical protein [Bacteroidota bacterium]